MDIELHPTSLGRERVEQFNGFGDTTFGDKTPGTGTVRGDIETDLVGGDGGWWSDGWF